MIYLYEYTSILSIALASNLAYVLYTRSNDAKGKTFFDLLSRHTDKHIDQINQQGTEALSDLRLLHSKLAYELQSESDNDGRRTTLQTLDENLREIEGKAIAVTNIIKDRASVITQFKYHSYLSVIAVVFITLLLILAPWSKYGNDFTPLFLLCGGILVAGVLCASTLECHTIKQWSAQKRRLLMISYIVAVLVVGFFVRQTLSPLCSPYARSITTYFCLGAAFSNFIIYFILCKCRLFKLSRVVYPRELKRIDIKKNVEFCRNLVSRITPKDVSYPADQVDITSC